MDPACANCSRMPLLWGRRARFLYLSSARSPDLGQTRVVGPRAPVPVHHRATASAGLNATGRRLALGHPVAVARAVIPASAAGGKGDRAAAARVVGPRAPVPVDHRATASAGLNATGRRLALGQPAAVARAVTPDLAAKKRATGLQPLVWLALGNPSWLTTGHPPRLARMQPGTG